MTAALQPGPSKVTFQPVSIPPPAGSKDPARDLMSYSIEPDRGDAPLKFFVGPKDFDVLARDRSRPRAGDQLRHVLASSSCRCCAR